MVTPRSISLKSLPLSCLPRFVETRCRGIRAIRRRSRRLRFFRAVANAFFRAGLIEAWGRGIERMMEACRAAGVPVPGLRYEPSGLWVEFSYPAIPMDSGAAETGGSGG